MNKKGIISIFVCLVFHSTIIGQETVESVFEKSRQFYLNRPPVSYLVYSSFKSAIAETINYDTLTISLCGNKTIITSGAVEKIWDNSSYLFINHSLKSYIDFSAYKTIIESLNESVKVYPFVSFQIYELKDKRYRLKEDSISYHVYDDFTRIAISKSDFSVISFRQAELSTYGIQIKSYVIATQSAEDCKKSDLTYLKSYKRVPVESKNKKPKNVLYKNFSEVLTEQELQDFFVQSGLNRQDNKWILLDLFYQSCYPCILGFKYAHSIGLDTMTSRLSIVGVNYVSQDYPTLPKFLKRYQLTFPVVTGVVSESMKKIFNPAGIAPVYVLISPEGKIEKVVHGFDKKFLSSILRKLD